VNSSDLNPANWKSGLLIINADDWGLDRQTTNRILDCGRMRRISSASAMVFMEDSERAAELSREAGMITGLHLNFTTPFSAPSCSNEVVERQRKIVASLRRHRFSGTLFHPVLQRHFEYVAAAQLDEFQRLYGAPAVRLDGHHHMHLCPNVLWTGLLPAGTAVRRSSCFGRGERGPLNRLYRSFVDRILARRHLLTDFFFPLAPLEPATRLQRIFSLASTAAVEVETHPVEPKEYKFLMSDDLLRLTENLRMVLPAQLR